MAKIDATYRDVLFNIFSKGYKYEDPNRKGVQRKELTSVTFRHELKDGFPALTTKEVYFKGAVQELLFFLSGKTDIRNLWDKGVHFWDKDWINFQSLNKEELKILKKHYKRGDQLYDNRYRMGRIYPYQYRNFNGRVDQIQRVLDTLRKNPMSTSMIVNAWNPDDLDDMCLPPCHYGFQIVGRPLKEGGYGFEIHWQQRSTDFFLGSPINIMYYGVLLKVFELLSGHKSLAIQGDLKNVHLYDNQWKVAKEQMERDVDKFDSSTLKINGDFSDATSMTIDEFLNKVSFDNFQLLGYESFPKLKAEMLSYDK